MHRIQQGLLTSHVQVCLVLAREAGLRQILGCGGGAHRDGRIVTGQVGAGLCDGLSDGSGHPASGKELPNGVRCGLQCGRLRDIHRFQSCQEGGLQAVLAQELPVSGGSYDEALGHRQAGRGEVGQGGPLATGDRQVRCPRIGQSQHVFSTLLKTAERLEAIHTRETTLESIFIQVTGQELAA